jgi:mannitol-1-phosphate/altronate dehydrogenase
VTEDGMAIIKGDSKDEIISKLGYADKKEVTIEGYECWIYEKTRLKLFFKGDHLREWVKF